MSNFCSNRAFKNIKLCFSGFSLLFGHLKEVMCIDYTSSNFVYFLPWSWVLSSWKGWLENMASSNKVGEVGMDTIPICFLLSKELLQLLGRSQKKIVAAAVIYSPSVALGGSGWRLWLYSASSGPLSCLQKHQVDWERHFRAHLCLSSFPSSCCERASSILHAASASNEQEEQSMEHSMLHSSCLLEMGLAEVTKTVHWEQLEVRGMGCRCLLSSWGACLLMAMGVELSGPWHTCTAKPL